MNGTADVELSMENPQIYYIIFAVKLGFHWIMPVGNDPEYIMFETIEIHKTSQWFQDSVLKYMQVSSHPALCSRSSTKDHTPPYFVRDISHAYA